MKRAPIVLSSTALGVAGLLSYHLAAPSSSVGSSTSHQPTSSTATAAATTTSSSTTTSQTATKTRSTTAKTVTGEDVSFQYGDIQLKVTKKDGKITDVSVARLDETDPRSQNIDEYAIPQLKQQALSAQSAHIDGISGASYTSAAYEQSLQSALDKPS